MADNVNPVKIAGVAGAVVGAAFVKDEIFGDDEPDTIETFDTDGDGELDASEMEAASSDIAAETDGGGSDAYEDYVSDQYAYEATSEMMDTMHETNMEIIDNMDGVDDYYYEETTDW